MTRGKQSVSNAPLLDVVLEALRDVKCVTIGGDGEPCINRHAYCMAKALEPYVQPKKKRQPAAPNKGEEE